MKLWIEQEQPLGIEEEEHLLSGTDFIALVDKPEECWLDRVVEQTLLSRVPRNV